jgi:DNA repair protein RecO (recombination protein O)
MKATDIGIFLHRLAYSETSLIVTFYTKEKGLRKFIFKGGKKKAHCLFPMSIGELSYFERKDSDLLHLTAVEPATTYQFQFDPIKSTIAFFIAEIVRKCVHQDEVDNAMFGFIEERVKLLNDSEGYFLFPVHFLIDLSEMLGIQPYIKDMDSQYFNLDEGTFEAFDRIGNRVVSGDVAALIRARVTGQEAVSFGRAVRENALEVMLDYFRIHVPGFDKIDSYDIIKEVLHA